MEETFAAVEMTEAFWRNRFAAVPWREKGGHWRLRYYQRSAAERVLDVIAAGRDRCLLALATGTGKTTIAFEIAWKLFSARWNLVDRKSVGEPTRRPRILFLADRNNLADQAYNDFSTFAAFEDKAFARIRPDEIRKAGRVPKNASVFFTIFQTFLSGPTGEHGDATPYFGAYPPHFFDLVIVDECHRGGARDESEWRDILKYFSPAVQLGLTATPKRRDNVDTYSYFGAPVYTYSLRQGIEDGFLTPFKVRQFATTLDDYVYTPDDTVVQGFAEEGRRYDEGDFNRTITITEREAYRVRTFMGEIDQGQKTLVFCRSQEHARDVRDLVNQIKTSADPHYCERVTAEDGALGDQHLRAFQDNEKTIPTILTTSQKLSTGVDARNVRNIVLLRPVNSLIEFKQIIGRGTRLYEGKEYFTIYDFVKAYEHFGDPEWDGEPVDPEPRAPGSTGDSDEPKMPAFVGAEEETAKRLERVVIRLADGKARAIQHISVTSFWGPDGRPMSAAQFMEHLFGKLPELFRDEDELRALWSVPETRRRLLDALAEQGFGPDQLAEMRRAIDAEGSDMFDVLAYVAYALPPITRAERVTGRRDTALLPYDQRLQAFLEFVMGQYVSQGVEELDDRKLKSLLEMKYCTVHDAAAELGELRNVRSAFIGFQRRLYAANP